MVINITDINIGVPAYTECAFSLNADGKSWISKTGLFSYGIRIGSDCDDTDPGLTQNTQNYVVFLLNENGSNEAKIDINYTAVGVAPTSVLYGPLVGPLGGPI